MRTGIGDDTLRTGAVKHRAGWQVATHAIGDAAIDIILDAYEEATRVAPRGEPRRRIEHCGSPTTGR